jgi:hypothetical protein
MALSALSIATNAAAQRVHSLEHYQKAITALRDQIQTTQDLYSDGALLTHFILLLYEV